jgi:tRNA(adenine34) deaminase
VNDTQAMERCIELARLSVEHGNHPFGSLITLDGDVLAESENTVVTDVDPSGHAEMGAIRLACKARGSLLLNGATLYTSCEPCWMCSAAIRRTGISRVVFALNGVTRGGGYTTEYAILSTADLGGFGPPPEIVPGFMADQSLALWQTIGWPH